VVRVALDMTLEQTFLELPHYINRAAAEAAVKPLAELADQVSAAQAQPATVASMPRLTLLQAEAEVEGLVEPEETVVRELFTSDGRYRPWLTLRKYQTTSCKQ
jgi:hypothetical protein